VRGTWKGPVSRKGARFARENSAEAYCIHQKGRAIGGRFHERSFLANNYRGDSMTLDTMQHIPLSSAYLCQDCNCVGNCARQCPACASAVLMGLAGVLDRELEDELEATYSRRPALVA